MTIALVKRGFSKVLSDRGAKGTPDTFLPDIVEFSAPHYYCKEDEGVVRMEVSRQGACRGVAEVDFRTVDGSAKEGKRFVGQKGTVRFEPGDRLKTIDIQLVQDDAFDTTLEFSVTLANAYQAQLGLYLWKAVVHVIDDDAFPTNRYRDQLQSNCMEAVPRWNLLLEYFKFNWQDRALRSAALRNFFSDQFSNFKFAWNIMLTNYIMDDVVRPPSGELPKNHAMVMFVIVCALLVPEALALFLDRRRAWRRIQGKAINKLQGNLLRKYLNFDENSRHMVSTSDLTMAITRDVPDLVQTGFLTLFDITEQAGLLLILLALSVTQNGKHYPLLTAVMVLGFPILCFAFFALRHSGSLLRHRKVVSCQTKMISFVKQTTDNFRLIADYFQLSTAVDMFGKKVGDLNNAYTDEAVWQCMNSNFTPALTTLWVLVFALATYQDAKEGGSLPIGQFVTGLGLWKSVGNCYQQIYFDVLKMQQSLSSLENVVYYMNLPVDVPVRMKNARLIHQAARKHENEVYSWLTGEMETNERGFMYHKVKAGVAEACQRGTGGNVVKRQLALYNQTLSQDSWEVPLYTADLMSLYGTKISFAYPLQTGGGTYVLDQADFQISQGKLVVVTGERGGGKATLLNLIGNVLLLPDCDDESTRGSSMLFVPPHTRVLHVGFVSQLVAELNLWENLCFGPSDGEDETAERILAICRRLGMSESVLRLLEAEANEAGERVPLPTPAFKEIDPRASAAMGKLTTRLSGSQDVKMFGTAESMVARRSAQAIVHGERLLSHTDRSLIHIARALIMNPEVLVLHKPLSNFDDVHGQIILEMLREFVDQRGILKPPETRLCRRPRTAIFSVASTRGTEVADVVFHVGAGKVEEVDVARLQHLRQLTRELFEGLDQTGNNRLSFADFVQNMPGAPYAKELLGVEKPDDKAAVGQLFKDIVGHPSALLEYEELVRWVRHYVSEIGLEIYTVGQVAEGRHGAPDFHHMPSVTPEGTHDFRHPAESSRPRLGDAVALPPGERLEPYPLAPHSGEGQAPSLWSRQQPRCDPALLPSDVEISRPAVGAAAPPVAPSASEARKKQRAGPHCTMRKTDVKHLNACSVFC